LSGEKAGYGGILRKVKVKPGETNDLCDLIMREGGIVSGRVLDINGFPVPGSRVCYTNFRIGPSFFIFLDLKRRGPLWSQGETKTDSSGYYRIETAPEGDVFIWAGAPGKYFTFTTNYKIEPSKNISGVDFVLHDIAPRDMIKGKVISPSGESVPHAIINVSYKTPAGVQPSLEFDSLKVDENGDFSFILANGIGSPFHDFEAFDPSGIYKSVRINGVKPGTENLVLRLK